MENRNLKPVVRFPEFTENWKETKFKNHFEFKNTNSLSRDKLNYESGSVKNIHYGDIHTKFNTHFDIEKEELPFINDDVDISRIDKENYVLEGDLVMADASEDYADIGKTIEITNTNNERILAGLHTFLARKTDKTLAKRFFGHLLTNYNVRLKLMRIAQGTKVLGLSKGRVEHITLAIPEPDEQKKIADFLTSIETRITALKEKKDTLLDFKKGVMQKLFNQEIRFRDNDGNDFPDWEEKKIIDVANIIGGGTPSTFTEEYWNGEINWFTPTEIKSRYSYESERKISEIGLKNSSATLLPINSILFTSRATIGAVSITKEVCSTNQGFQSFIPKENSDIDFIYYWIQYNSNKFIRVATGTTFIEVSKKEVEKIDILKPHKKEQFKIGQYFKKIDDKIEGVQQKIDASVDFKKGLLQKMFV